MVAIVRLCNKVSQIVYVFNLFRVMKSYQQALRAAMCLFICLSCGLDISFFISTIGGVICLPLCSYLFTR